MRIKQEYLDSAKKTIRVTQFLLGEIGMISLINGTSVYNRMVR